MHSTVHKILKELSLTVNVARGRTSYSMPLRKKAQYIWSFTSIYPIYLHGLTLMHTDNFTFLT